jgi:uncharacterized protein
MKTAAYWIEKLGLQAYPRGGYFREMYRAAEAIPAPALPRRFSGAHAFSTAIYFLLQGDQVSPLHRLKADEIWHFYAGESLTIHLFKPDGSYEAVVLGSDPDQGQAFQVVVPAACWFGATLNQRDSYVLVGCTVAPGFEIADFESADQTQMIQLYPAHQALIVKLTG